MNQSIIIISVVLIIVLIVVRFLAKNILAKMNKNIEQIIEEEPILVNKHEPFKPYKEKTIDEKLPNDAHIKQNINSKYCGNIYRGLDGKFKSLKNE